LWETYEQSSSMPATWSAPRKCVSVIAHNTLNTSEAARKAKRKTKAVRFEFDWWSASSFRRSSKTNLWIFPSPRRRVQSACVLLSSLTTSVDAPRRTGRLCRLSVVGSKKDLAKLLPIALHPSRATRRNPCGLIFRSGRNEDDERIFRRCHPLIDCTWNNGREEQNLLHNPTLCQSSSDFRLPFVENQA